MNITVSRLETSSGLEDRTVGVYMTEEDAELFKIFMKYRSLWKQIFERDNRNTEIRLLFNGENNMQVIKEIRTFRS